MDEDTNTTAAGPAGDDPRRIATIVVHADDIVTALEARKRSDRAAVLRIIPPFSGRMRARLHDARIDDTEARIDDTGPVPIHIDPRGLVADPPAYPEPDQTEDRFRSERLYDVDRHRDAHASAVDAWRTAVRSCFVETVTLEVFEHDEERPEADERTTDPSRIRHDVRVSVLGT